MRETQVQPHARRVLPLPLLLIFSSYQYHNISDRCVELSLSTFLILSPHSFDAMADDKPRRLSAESNDGQSLSPPADTAYADRHGSRVIEALYPSQTLGEGSGSGSRFSSLTNRRPATVTRPSSPERRRPFTPPVRPLDPVTRLLARSLEMQPGINSAVPSSSTTQALSPVENPILTTQTSTPAWWVEGGRGLYSYPLSLLASTNDLINGDNISDGILTQPYSQTRWSTSPDVRSSTHGSPNLPAVSAADDNLRPTQDLLQHSRTPSDPSVSGEARSDAVETANVPELPARVLNPASTTRNRSPPSGHQLESSSTTRATTNKTRLAQYRSVISPSSPSPLSGSYTLCTPSNSPLSGYVSRSVSSSPNIYTPSGKQQLADPVLGVVDSSSTLFYSQEQRHPLVQQQPEVQLELTEALNLTPKITLQPRDDSRRLKVDATQSTVTRLTGDRVPASPTKNAVKAVPERLGMFQIMCSIISITSLIPHCS